eukprot:TRINITY_DN11185_c0_g2_i3.p1 TRINITY_DN11185_c0_g2~~TRINITY_DN11185_c0_g2_i3.p1  ORF type:complete len:371 (+),score=34.54 TRINITY_DN11185_c0_g2_i3:507-1619(+)
MITTSIDAIEEVYNACKFVIVDTLDQKTQLQELAAYFYGVRLDSAKMKDKFLEILSENPNLIAVDLNNEFGLYQQVHADNFASSLKKAIKNYEDLAKRQLENGESAEATHNLISVLSKELDGYVIQNTGQHKIRKVTREEMANNLLKKIFEAYNRQKAIGTPKKSFATINDEINRMSIESFVKFVRDFDIEIPVQKQKELFIKTATCGKYLLFDQFLVILKKIAEELNLIKVKDLKWKHSLVAFKLARNEKKLEEHSEQLKDQFLVEEVLSENFLEDIHSKSQEIRRKLDRLNKELAEICTQISFLESKKVEELINELYNHMEIYSPNTVIFISFIVLHEDLQALSFIFQSIFHIHKGECCSCCSFLHAS